MSSDMNHLKKHVNQFIWDMVQENIATARCSALAQDVDYTEEKVHNVEKSSRIVKYTQKVKWPPSNEIEYHHSLYKLSTR